jgi:hypothetical protein
MTEVEWLACDDPYRMLDFLPSKASGRKLRLFACGCCRQRVWHLLPEQRSRDAVETAERYAEGEVDRNLLRTAWAAAREAAETAPPASGSMESQEVPRMAAAAAVLAAHRSRRCARATAGRVFSAVYYGDGLYNETRRAAERAAHLALVRCVFGNPFRPVPLHRSWLTPTVTNLAAVAYEERALPSGQLDPARLAVLADALEEAGCSDADLLAHLRGPGPHVRGCHAVDAVLGKE